MKEDIKLHFYKRNGYYIAKGNQNIEFCCDKFDKVTGNKRSRFCVLITKKKSRGYKSCSIKKFLNWIVDGKNTPFGIWRYVTKEVLEITGSKFYFKITAPQKSCKKS